jgi:ATP-dependent DNA helicase RecG
MLLLHLNNAGKVLFSKNKPIVLKLATFAGTTKETFTKLNHFEGNVYECIDEAITYIHNSINWNITIDRGAQRIEVPEIPSVAIREIVVNAFAHGKYDSNTTFEINVFKDRVTVYSPGIFPIGFIPEDFVDSTESPIMLNPKIVNVLFKTGEIESFGAGYTRTFRACKKIGIEISYENTKSGFRFVFYRPHGRENVYEMSMTERLVYEEIKKNNLSTAKMIAETLGKSEKTVYRAISSLKKQT